MAYQLIAFDMDGTLLDSKKDVLPSSVAAIDEALASGKDVAIASGRCPRMVLMYRDVIPHVRYAICSAGAAIVDLFEAKTLKTTEVPATALQKVMAATHGMDKFIETTCDGEFIVPGPEMEHCERYSLGVYKSLYSGQGTVLDSADAAEAIHRFLLGSAGGHPHGERVRPHLQPTSATSRRRAGQARRDARSGRTGRAPCDSPEPSACQARRR